MSERVPVEVDGERIRGLSVRRDLGPDAPQARVPGGVESREKGVSARMTKGPFRAKRPIRGGSPTDPESAPLGSWFCINCTYLKTVRCNYKKHRSFQITGPESQRRYERTVQALHPGVKKRTCLNPECESPFLPLHASQTHCDPACSDRAAYLRRRVARGAS